MHRTRMTGFKWFHVYGLSERPLISRGRWTILSLVLSAWLAVLGFEVKADDAPPQTAAPKVGVSQTNRITRRYSASAAGSSEPTVPGPPYALNLENIVKFAFLRNPSVRASREEMLAAKHGLDEFRANLNRTEPYVEMRNDVSSYPNRKGAFGDELTSVVGVRKETFEGSIMSAEVGPSFSRYTFDPSLVTGNPTEFGAKALIHARVEIPFVGSRRRQDRIIAQAYQESTSRKAQLDYLKNYRTLVESALSYYNLVIYYRRLVESYAKWTEDLDQLMKDPRVHAHDRPRIESVRSSADSYRGQYQSREDEYLTILLAYIGLEPGAPVTVEAVEYQMSPLAEAARQQEGLNALIEKARSNNPTFEVLQNAIRNAELQHDQALKGKFDVTTFVEGSLFPFGSKTFDDRYNGWTVGAGVNVRLNDSRVRSATKLKTEALIRQFKAEMEAEEIGIRRKVVSTTKALWDNDANRSQMLEVAKRKSEEYGQRLKDYYADQINIDQLLSTRSEMTSNAANLANTIYNSADREATLILAIGQIYEIVGLKIGDSDPKKH